MLYRNLGMEEFIYNYIGEDYVKNHLEYMGIQITPQEYIDALVKVPHKDLDGFNFPYLKRVPFDIVQDGMLRRGLVLYVTDVTGKEAPYIRPDLIKEFGKVDIVEYYNSERASKPFNKDNNFGYIYEEPEMSEEEAYEALEGVFTEEDFLAGREDTPVSPQNEEKGVTRKLVNNIVYKN